MGRGDVTGSPPTTEFAILRLQCGATGILVYNGSTWPGELQWEGIHSEGRQWIADRGWMGASGRWERGAGNIRVYGSGGVLRVFHYANKLFVGTDGDLSEVRVAPVATPLHFGFQLSQFCHDLDNHLPASTPAADGIRALKALEAIYRSAKTAVWQELGE
jgi:predicted dehydrogenase